MSQYPIDDTAGSLLEAVNYLLSGPSGLGQNFEGMSAVGNSFITQGAFTNPLTQTFLTGLPILGPAYDGIPPIDQPGTVQNTDDVTNGQLLVYPLWNTLPGGLPIIAITPVTATGRQITITVDTTSAVTNVSQEPFVLGQQVVLSGITPSSFNGTYTVLIPAGWFTPNASVTLIQDTEETWGVYVSGGVLKINDDFTGNTKTQTFFTGNQAVVTVTGPTDRVFISSQMNRLKVYTYTYLTAYPLDWTGFYVNLEINRYRAVQKTTIPDTGAGAIYAVGGSAYNGYLWEFEETIVSVRNYTTFNLSSTTIDTNNFGDVIYNNIIDNPGIGTYLYAFQISQPASRDSATPDVRLIMGAETTGVRSFTAQAIKR